MEKTQVDNKNLLVYKFHCKDNKINQYFIEQCKIATKLYNQTLYYLNQQYKDNGVIPKYTDVDKIMRTMPNLESDISNYNQLNSQVAQQCIKRLYQNFESFFKSIKDYKVNPKKYTNRPQPPQYKKGNELCNLYYTYIAFSITNKGEIKFGISTKIPNKIKNPLVVIPQYEKYCNKIPQQKINPKANEKYVQEIEVKVLPNQTTQIYIKYQIEYPKEIKYANEYILGCDFGVKKIITIVSTKPNFHPIFLQTETALFNRYNYMKNKRIKKYKHCLGICQKGQKTSKHIKHINETYKNQINDLLHKISSKLIKVCLEHNINRIIIGYNKNWKKGTKLGEQTIRFQEFPFERLKKCLEYKCKLHNIEIEFKEESYTSKCSCYDMEKICKHDNYVGKRLKQNVFKTQSGKSIHADVNGAYNIIRKHNSDVFNNINTKSLIWFPKAI